MVWALNSFDYILLQIRVQVPKSPQWNTDLVSSFPIIQLYEQLPQLFLRLCEHSTWIRTSISWLAENVHRYLLCIPSLTKLGRIECCSPVFAWYCTSYQYHLVLDWFAFCIDNLSGNAVAHHLQDSFSAFPRIMPFRACVGTLEWEMALDLKHFRDLSGQVCKYMP